MGMVSIGEACYLVRVEGWTELVLTSFGGDPFCGRRALTVSFLAHQARLYLLTIDETAAPAPWSPPHHPYHPTTAAAQRQHAQLQARRALAEERQARQALAEQLAEQQAQMASRVDQAVAKQIRKIMFLKLG